MNVITSILFTFLLVACGGSDSAAPPPPEPPTPPPGPVVPPKPEIEIPPFDITEISAPLYLKNNRMLTFSWDGYGKGRTFSVCKKDTGLFDECALIGIIKDQNHLNVEMEDSLDKMSTDEFFILAKTDEGATQKTLTHHVNKASINALIQYIKSSKPHDYDSFGWSVALSADGRTLAIGANGDDSSTTGVNNDEYKIEKATESGAVYVFYYGPSGWRQEAFIKASNTDKNDLFGYSVSLNGDGTTLAVGALNEAANGAQGAIDQSDNSTFGAGAVYVFEQNPHEGWQQKARIKASNAAIGDNFGQSVSLSTNAQKLAISANKKTTQITGGLLNILYESGSAYVFKNKADTWEQEAYFTAKNTGEKDYFGSALSMSADGNTLAVGAPHKDNNGATNKIINSGAAYIFKFESNIWIEKFYLKASNMDPNDNFGYALSLSGDGKTLAVGAPFESSSATQINGDESNNLKTDSGAVYLFEDKTNHWKQTVYFKARNSDIGDIFGSAVSLNHDGRALAVGAMYEDSSATGLNGDEQDNSIENSGAVYMFKKDLKLWIQNSYIKASNTGKFDLFGFSLSLSANGRTLAVSSKGENSNATGVNGDENNELSPGSGAVYTY